MPAVRVALHNELKGFSDTAHGIALTTPGFDQKFRLPRSGSDQALLASAVAFVADATPVQAIFLANEMPADCLMVRRAGANNENGARTCGLSWRTQASLQARRV